MIARGWCVGVMVAAAWSAALGEERPHLVAKVEPVVAGKPTPRADRLAERLTALADKHAGKVAYAVVNFDTGEAAYRDPDEPMPTASLIKLPVLVEAYRQDRAGRISLADAVALRDEDKVPGSGILSSHFSAGTTLPLRDVCRLMIVYSDNTATNLVIDQVGLKAVAETTAALGLPETRMNSKVFRGDTSIAPDRSRRFGLGSTTARDMALLLGRLHRGELVDAAACKAMRDDLLACDDKLKLPRFLPPGTKLAHKTGSVNAVRTDAGLLETPEGTVAVCVLTNDNADKSWGDSNAAEILIGEIGRTVLRHFSRGTDAVAGRTTPAGPLGSGANGDLVEDLQRTLNAALSPSPDLSVDGDFGSVTRAAVERFQKAKGLPVTGTVGPETWAALGPIVPPQPVADPAAIAREAAELTTAPADDPSGPPLVSCEAWAIGDAATGETRWESAGDVPRPIASTTKVMTAYVVLELAAQHPEVLDEIVTVSERADDTPGSTAGVRAGERLSVRELLFGLLLPSGNDAATAFAEHFGSRFDPPADRPDADPFARFVAEMNRTAARLGMTASGFRNPHGLEAAGHAATARDLLKLAAAARKFDLFRQITATRLHGCTVEGPGGYRRNVRWENTNKLLGFEGYAGVKTGTTDAAGACLIAFAAPPPTARGSGPLLAVVLGSPTDAGRYADTRNLFRWAWRQETAGD